MVATIRFAGRSIAAVEGESVFAALTAAGVAALGSDARGGARGGWCGMGACQACLVTIDGVAAQRACMAKVRDGMTIEPGEARVPMAGRSPSAPPRRADDIAVEAPDMLVVGAGPAGLAAATTARAAGIDVLVIDERAQAGGQYFKQRDAGGMAAADAQQREGAKRIAEAVQAGVRFLHRATVWGAFPGPELIADTPEGALRIRPRTLVLATGAIEVAWPVEGWTLPGVMTTGAAQTMWRTARRAPPGRIVIAGNGPLNLQLAAELVRGGANVVALAEAAARPGAAAIGDIARMAAAAPALVAQGVAYRAAVARAGVRMIEGTQLSAVMAGDDGLVAMLDDGSAIAADTICIGYGLSPADELARAMGCIGPVDRDMQTPVAGIFRVGDGVRMGGAHIAAAQGRIAGAAVAARFGHALPVARARGVLARHERFQAALWRVYAPARPLSPRITGDSVICRCEGVRRAGIDAAREAGATTMAGVKLVTRAGMGACQGRYCLPLLKGMCGDDDPGIAPRVPVRPVSIGDLAR